MNIIELNNVEKIYSGMLDTKALDNINLSFEQGSFSSIVGESGSGKSTLLNIMGTLDRPSSGELFIDGQRTSGLDANGLAKLRNSTIGFVFQFHYLLPEFNALENVLMPCYIARKKAGANLAERAEELFEILGISGIRNKMVNKLSGGQQQRTAIARALINNPRVFLADEPTGNLDSENTANIYRIFRELNLKYGTTFIIVTHDRNIAGQTDRIIEIKDGKVTSDDRR